MDEKRRIYLREWKRRNPDKVAMYRARENRDAAKLRRAALRYKWKNIERVRKEDRERQRIRRQHLPASDFQRRWYLAKLEKLAGRSRPSVCDICGEPAVIVFDHCHTTKRFRGWLCQRCNRVLGSVKENPTLLRSMIKYLERHNGRSNRNKAKGAPKARIRRQRSQLSNSR